MSDRKNQRATTLFESALQQFRQGRVEAARQSCLQVIGHDPRHPGALHLLGVIALQMGEPAAAVETLQQALAVDPGNPGIHANLGYGYVGLARPADALAAFERATKFDPRDPDARLGVGNCLALLGRLPEAEAALRQLVERHPRHVLGWFNLAHTVANQQRHEEARDLYSRVTEIEPRQAEAWSALGTVHHQLEQYEAALDCHRKAQALEPSSADAHLGIGMALHKLGRTLDALPRLQQALTLNPGLAEACFHMGNVRQELRQYELALEAYRHAMALSPAPAGEPVSHTGSMAAQSKARERRAQLLLQMGVTHDRLEQVEEALTCFEQALSLMPDDPPALHNLAAIYHKLDRTPESIALCEKALALEPELAEALETMGTIHSSREQWEESLSFYERALRIDPHFETSRFNSALIQLMTGDLERGWTNYEWRFRQEDVDARLILRPSSDPEWRGEPLAGRRILIWGEQGVGDELLHAGMIAQVARDAAHCVFECSPKLVPLLARSLPGAQVVPRQDPPHEAVRGAFDYQVPAGDLARWLRSTPESFPRHSGYLVPLPERVAHWKERLGALGTGLKIGFGWRSSNLKGERAKACTTLEQWGPIFTTPGVHFVNLQYGDVKAELEHARHRFPVPLHAFPEVDLFDDLDEAAALTRACDLVISAPTATSVLAAALGVPTWQMTTGLDWQRLGTENLNPWYPAMKVYKRAHDQAWEAVIGDIAAALSTYVAGQRSGQPSGQRDP